MLEVSERPPEVEGRDESEDERVVDVVMVEDMVGASLGCRWWRRPWKCGRCMLESSE